MTEADEGLQGGVLGALAGAVRAALRRLLPGRHASLEVWRRLARELGLGDCRVGPGRIAGVLDGLPVEVRALTSQTAEVEPGHLLGVVEISVRGGLRFPERLDLGPEDPGGTLHQPVRGQEIMTGDPQLDGEVVLWGDPIAITALLDARTRARVRALLESGGAVKDGVLTRRITVDHTETRAIAEEVRGTLVLACQLLARSDPVEALARNARSDPLAAVRLHNLEVLLGSFPTRPVTAETCRTLLQDGDSKVRLAAARALPEEGRAVLLDLATGEAADEDVATAALEALGARMPAENAFDVLRRARAAGRPALVGAAVSALARTGGPEAVACLAGLLRDSDRRLAMSAAHALGQTGDPAAAAPLLRVVALRSDALAEVAAIALGPVGTVEDVPALRTLLSRRPLGAELRRAILGAVAAIQRRAGGAGGAEPGQLTLVVGEGGELALAEEESGRLAMAKAAAGHDEPGHEQVAVLPVRRG